MAEAKKKRKFRFPILLKTAVVIFVFSFVIVELAMTYYSLVISNRNKETYSNYADSLSATVSKVLDSSEVNVLQNKVDSILDTIPEDELVLSDGSEADLEVYMAHFDSLYDDAEFMTAFNNIRDHLRDIVSAHSKFAVDCMYLAHIHTYLDAQGEQQGVFVYLVDTAPDEEACPPGWLDPLYDINRPLINDQERGMPAYFTNTPGYGYLVTAGSYIKDTNHVYICADISMTLVRARQAKSITRLFIYLLVTVILLSIVGVILVYFMFARPLKKISNVAKQFNNKDPKATHRLFTELNVKTRDELYDLAESIKTMESGVVQRFNELIEVNDALVFQEKQTAKMTAIANRDSLTGVGSKTAYDYETSKMNDRIANKEHIVFGLAMIDLNYLKNTNDEYGHFAGDEALIKLAHIICLTFKHSPVYRVGGDEFVVALTGEEYDKAEALIAEFNERIQDCIENKKLPEFERISAAIGYATYIEGTDTCVDDVFKRADQKMYQRKHEMKEKK